MSDDWFFPGGSSSRSAGLGEVNMGDPEKEAAILLTEYLETPQSDWVHREIEGKPDSYDIDVDVPRLNELQI